VFAVRQGNHGTVPADAGASGVVPGLLSAEAASGFGVMELTSLGGKRWNGSVDDVGESGG